MTDADSEKRTSRFNSNSIIMKKFILTSLVIISFMSTEFYAQTELNSFVINDLSTLVDKNTSNPEVWPWNGCKEFTINVKLKVVEVEFVVLICCAQGVCAPYNTQRSPFTGTKSIQVTKSSKVNYGKYSISIAKGTYNVDGQGRPMELKYLVEQK